VPHSRTAPEPLPPRLEFKVPPRGAHLLRARERLRDYLTQYCAQRELIDDVVLCIEEACTNAIRHSGCDDDITIGLEFTDGRLVAVVRDRGRGFDVACFSPALPEGMADHGRGLYIIASLMDDLELRCEGGCQVRMSRCTAARPSDRTVESGLGEVHAPAGERDTRVRGLLEEIDEAFVALDWEYRCVHANGAALQFVDKDLGEVVGMRPCDLAPELTGSALERSCRDAMELGRPGTVEHRLGSGAWFEVRVYPTPAGVSAYFRPIDDRKRIEQERERLLEAYRLELSRSTLLRDVARAATSSLGLDLICERVLEQVHAHAGLRAATIRMVDWERRSLRSLAVFGDPGAEAGRLDEAPLSGDTISGRLLTSDLPELTDGEDTVTGGDDGEVVRPPTSTWLALPIAHQDETLGAMTLFFASPTPLDRESIDLYHSVAATLGAAMAHARSYQLEVEAQETLRRYELLAAEARDIMLFVRRRDGRILEANRAAESAYGYSRDALLRLTIHDLRDSETTGQTGDQMAAAAHEGVLFETVHRRRDGSSFPVEVSSRGTTSMAGEVVLLSVVRDITNRLAAQRALRDSEDRYRSLVDMSPEAILVHVEGRYVFANPAAAELLGADSPDQLLGRPVLDFIHADHHAATARRIEQAHLGRVTPLERMRWLRLDGDPVDVEVTGTGTEYAGMPAVQIVVRSRDEQARVEAALRDSERRTSAELGFTNTLLRAAEALSSSMQIDTVLDRLAELLIDAVGADRLIVLLWDRMESELSVAVAKGGPSLPLGTRWPRHGAVASPIVARLVADRAMKTIDFEGSGVPRRLRRAAARVGLRLALAVPITARGELLGYVAMDERGARRAFDEREIRLAKAICVQAGAALDNARLYQQEHDVAQVLRAALLKLPDAIAGLSFAHHYHPAARPAHVGGDFYDLFELDHGLVGIVVGDISGKGIEAAVLTSLVKNTIRAHATERGKTPAEVMALTNTVLARETAAETFATVFFGMLDRRDGRLVYCNAGHPASVVMHADGGIAVLPPTSPLIGAFSGFTYHSAEAYVSSDDLLFLYTDGLTEARSGRRLFGERRLFDLLAELGPSDPGLVVAGVIEAAVEFADGGLHDDLAVLALRRAQLPGPSQQKLRFG
jgi:PAS domain S-box-containing protein